VIVGDDDDVLAIRSSGSVTRSPVRDVRATGRDTMGVTFVDVAADDAVVAISRVVEDDLGNGDAVEQVGDEAVVGEDGES
jgi:DNA gyrase subunit A